MDQLSPFALLKPGWASISLILVTSLLLSALGPILRLLRQPIMLDSNTLQMAMLQFSLKAPQLLLTKQNKNEKCTKASWEQGLYSLPAASS